MGLQKALSENMSENVPLRVNLIAERSKELVDQLPGHLQSQAEKYMEALVLHGKADPEKDASGLELYTQLCQMLECAPGEIVYNEGQIKKLLIVSDGKSITAVAAKINEKHIKDLFDMMPAKVALLTRYVLLHYMFPVNPKLHKYAYSTIPDASNEKGFRFRDDLKIYETDWDKLMQGATEQKHFINHKTSSIELFIPPAPIRKRANVLINEYFRIVFGDEYSLLAKRHAALYAFENRYGISRPTLILYGDRGTFKNLHCEKFLGSIYKGLISKATPNKSFNSYLDCKMLYFDETTGDKHGNLLAVYDELKELSGGSTNYISKKYAGDYVVDNGIYPVLLSNDPKPIHIKDAIRDEYSNQFLVMELRYSESNEHSFNTLKKNIQRLGYRDFEDFFDDHIGYYLWSDLFQVYSEMKASMKDSNYRYGMPIPITKALQKIQSNSVTEPEKVTMQILTDFYYGKTEAYSVIMADPEMQQMFLAFGKPKTLGVIPLRLLRMILIKEKIYDRSFVEVVQREGLVAETNTKIAVSKTVANNGRPRLDTCIVIDYPLLEQRITGAASNPIVYNTDRALELAKRRQEAPEEELTDWR
jgi:hypothetical protein